jgi:hypothetical protein
VKHLVLANFLDYAPIASEFEGATACVFSNFSRLP